MNRFLFIVVFCLRRHRMVAHVGMYIFLWIYYTINAYQYCDIDA